MQHQQSIALQQQALQSQYFTPNLATGHNGYGNFGGAIAGGTQTITTVEMAQIVTQLGVGSESGENRKKAMTEGQNSIQQLEHRIQTSLSQLGVCPVGFQWVPTADASGYMCCGGELMHLFINLLLECLFHCRSHVSGWCVCSPLQVVKIWSICEANQQF